MKLRLGFILLAVCLLTAMFSCRRNQPALVDANRPPDTELWYVPADSSEYDYLVHTYWRGVDPDGVVVRYIWTIRDTIEPPPLGWNPAARIRDFREGQLTSRTDSVFAFTAFQSTGGVGVKKNRQAFYIAAVDDNGVIDPFPAAVEFVATVGELPRILFTTWIPGSGGPRPFLPTRLDTVGMFRPFSISYSGSTKNGSIRSYRFFPLTANIELAGQNEWTTDLSDTLRVFPNVGPDALPSGRFRLAAQVRDDAGAESQVDAGQFRTGVAQVVVNFEPDTEIFEVTNTYCQGTQCVEEPVNFTDANPDTLPYSSWVTLFYRGWDSGADSSLCQDVVNKCLRYQVQYTSRADVDGGPENGGVTNESTVRWLPDDGEDNNEFGTADSTSLNVGSASYTVRARTVDEYGKPDGTPDDISVVGNFRPTLDSYSIVNYDGTVIGDGDTITWDWWNPSNYKGTPQDTIDISDPFNIRVIKKFFFVLNGAGHDHPKEPLNAGVRSWIYTLHRTSSPTVIERVARSGFWTDGLVQNTLSDTIAFTIRYSFIDDLGGFEAFRTLPSWLNEEYDITIRGRDLALTDVYEQFMFVNGDKVRLNAFNVSVLSRWTGEVRQRFYLAVTQ
ncbi:MAG: hypothetical protein OEN01_05695 [Candidatus Krumholzibacteria bacterium]|nr:hypothetical protein [Candidatus Krumholzibacteria bacterium]